MNEREALGAVRRRAEAWLDSSGFYNLASAAFKGHIPLDREYRVLKQEILKHCTTPQPAQLAGVDPVSESVDVIRGIMQFIREKSNDLPGLGFDPHLAEERVNARLDMILSVAPPSQAPAIIERLQK